MYSVVDDRSGILQWGLLYHYAPLFSNPINNPKDSNGAYFSEFLYMNFKWQVAS